MGTTEKENLLRMVRKVVKSKKHKPKKIQDISLEVEGIASDVFPEAQIMGKNYSAKSEKLRKILKKMTED